MITKTIVKYLPVYFGLVTLFAFWVDLVDSFAERNSEIFKRINLSGTKIMGSPYHFEPLNLFEYINGAADFFIAYGFVSLEGGNYLFGSDSKDSVTVDIYDMGKKLNAFGVYQSKRSEDAPPLSFGAASFGADGYIAFYKDRYFVEINAFVESDQWKIKPLKIAQEVAEKIPGDCLPPNELSYFPEKGRINGSEKYVIGGILGHAFLDKGIICNYTIETEMVSAFISFFPSKREAVSSYEQYKRFLNGPITFLPLDGFEQQAALSLEPYHKQVLFIQKDRFILGVYDVTKPETGKRLLKDMVERLDRL